MKPVKPFILKFVPLQVQINLFSWERFCTLPRFETEAEGKSEWPVGSFSVNDVELLFYPVNFNARLFYKRVSGILSFFWSVY